MKHNFFSSQFEGVESAALERKQNLRRKRFINRMERKLWLKQQYGRHHRGSSRIEQPYYSRRRATSH